MIKPPRGIGVHLGVQQQVKEVALSWFSSLAGVQPLMDLHVERLVQPRKQRGKAPAPALQVGSRERRVEVRHVRTARGLHDLRHHLLEPFGLAMVVKVCQVARKHGAREEVQHRRERHAADVHRDAGASQPADVVD